ncbi:MAG: hypothetical protein NTZ11_07395 [Gammaproteobacteria bacterium]|nr:hypothetical protein [Gammaproteobacteria bacterium]
MIERLHLSVVLMVAAVIWGILLVLNGVVVQVSWLRYASTVTGVLMLMLAVFDIWLWKWTVLQGWFVKRPVVDGTWCVELRSNWKDPTTGKRIAPIPGFMVIRQSFSRMSLRLITAESRSELLGAEVLRADDASYRITGVYRNEPRMSVRHRSQIHYGALVLQVCGKPIVQLEGHYWTDRDTTGELLLTERRAAHVDDFAAGEKLFAPSP